MDSIVEGLGYYNYSKFWILEPSLFHYRASSRTMGACPYQQPGNCAAFCIALPCLASPVSDCSHLQPNSLLLHLASFFYLLTTSVIYRLSIPCLTSHHHPYSRNRATPTPEVLINALDTHCFLCILENHPWPHISPSSPGWRQKDPRATPDPRGLFLPQNQSLCHVTGRAALAPSTLPGNAV